MTQAKVRSGEWIRTLEDAGWDPFEPSDECRAVTERPAMWSWLEPGDVVGIHWILASVELERKFQGGLGEYHLFAASLFALAECEVEGGISIDSATRHFNMLHEWYAGRYTEASQRLGRATSEEFEASPRAYEPATSFIVLSGERGWIDFDGNRVAALAGLREVESRGILGGDASGIVLPELSDEDVGRLLDLMTTKNPGQKLSWVTDEGQFRLSPRNVRDAIELNIGEVKPVHEPMHDGRRECGENVVRPEPTVSSLVADKDELADVERLLQEYQERHPPDSLEVGVAQNYLGIKKGEVSPRGLAEPKGLHPETVRKRVREIDEFLRRRRGLSA